MNNKTPVNIKVDKTIATLIGVYCKLNNLKIIDFATSVLSEKLKDFEERLKELRKLN